MSSDSEIKDKKIFQTKPYLSKRELAFLLNKKGKNLDKKVSQLLKKEDLLPLKRGLYTSRIYFLTQKEKFEEFLANILYYPSYLSLEYVLQKESLIPESVYVYTSITLKVPRIFKNKIGVFFYRKIKDSLFTGYVQVPFRENYQIKMATRAKALFDFLYLKSFKNSLKQELIFDLRLNWDLFTPEDFQEFLKYVALSSSKKMELIAKILKGRLYGH